VSESERATRDYLQFLRDPDSLRNDAEIARLEESVRSASDPLDELQARSALLKVQSVDGSTFRDAFIDHAKAYAEANDIAPSAFQEMGVPDADLRAAGLLATGSRRASATRGRIGVADVKAALPEDSFTTRDLEDRTGASYGTIRKAIAELIDEGVVVDVGPVRDWAERGRAPTLYRRA